MAHSVATPALLSHKEPAQGTQSPLLGALGRNAPYWGHFLPFAGSLWHKTPPLKYVLPLALFLWHENKAQLRGAFLAFRGKPLSHKDTANANI